MNITDYFNVDVCNYASYDNYRKIGSCIDGLKPSSRKCIYTVLKNNITTPKKVSQLKSDAASQTQYLHGDQSLEGVFVSLAQDFAGSNNIPLLKREGTFGTRLIPSAAAGRYIFTCKEDYLDYIFRKEDEPVLIQQIFEGEVIEPKFYVPIIPLLVVNGSIGLTTGFTQKILQHNIKDVIKYLKNKLNGSKHVVTVNPYFKDFTGIIEEAKDKDVGSWIISGKISQISSNEIEITEIPVNYTLESYTSILDKLEDEKLIKEYRDLSDNGKFKFRVKLYRNGQGIEMNDKNILSKLKLISAVTENYTSFDENNKIFEFKSIYEILDHFYNVRLKFYQHRKDHIINDLKQKIVENVSKYTFINGVVTDEIKIAKKTNEEIIKQLEKFDKIIKLNDSYDYLLNMPMRSMTKEQLKKLLELVKSQKEKLNSLKETTLEQMWLSDLDELEKKL
jgi:DNA topoisomerase-2